MTLYIFAFLIIVALWLIGFKNKEVPLVIVATLLAVIIFGVYIAENVDVTRITEPIVHREASLSGESMYIHMIDVGQGDAIYIEYGDVDILIDGGPRSATEDLLAYLANEDIDDFELVIATHAHEDHIGGLDDVINTYDVKRVIHSGESRDTQTFASFDEAAKSKAENYDEDESEVIVFDDLVSLEIIDIVDNEKETNNNSVIALVSYGDKKALFCGDAEYEVEEMLLKTDIDVDIFKASHHGSDTSNTLAFINKVSPEYVMISAGKDNKYGHPKKTAIGNFLAFTQFIYGTWVSGDIVIELNHEGIIPDEGLKPLY